MTDLFTETLDETEQRQSAYGDQLGFVADRTPFAAESLPDSQVAVRVNQDLLQEVASHILNRAGHVSVLDQRGAGKTHFRELVYDALAEGPRSDEFAIARIREVDSITTRRLYTRLLDALRRYDALTIPETYPHPTDEVRQLVEDVAEQLAATDRTCIVQVDQLEDAAQSTRTFEQLLAGLQSIGDLGEAEPVFLLFLFGTPAAGQRIEDVRETLTSRLVAKDRSLERFEFAEIEELVTRWLAWARAEDYTDGYPADPYTAGAIQTIGERSDGTPRSVRHECYHAFRAGARQYASERDVSITTETIETYTQTPS
jgi:type II secretory pathway predicted ATPase ExeA